ncbi:MAG: hypothetical protein ABSB11_04910 [Sedimentisphaerales bacterium]
MAKLIFSVPEILEIIKSNYSIPWQIEYLRAEKNQAWFRLETGLKFPAKIEVSLEFLRFERDMVIFHTNIEWVTSICSLGIPDMILKLLIRSLLKLKELGIYIELNEYPNIAINLNKILTDKIKGIQVKDVTFDDGLFTITT